MKKHRNTTASLTSRLMSGGVGGEQPENEPKNDKNSEISPQMVEALNERRTQNVGRPKNAERRPQEEGLRYGDTRATFIVKKDIVRKLKYISLKDTKTQKELIGGILSDYVAKWEKQNGIINI